jgi:WD40 repeat protein
MLERVDAGTLQEDIAALQWIGTDGASVSDVAARIIAAYHTDLEWLREQARLTVRVAEWESNARAAAFELRGEDLEQSEQWLARADSRDGRNATPGLTTYVIASRRGATRRTQRALLFALAALVVMTVLGTVAYLQYLRSERERRGAVAERLAAESVRARLERRPQRALLLAVAAVRTRTDRGEIAAVEALDALYTASTNLGGAPIGASGTSIEALSLFPDDDACISGSDDGILRIWSTASAGPSLFAINAHKGGVTLVTTGRNGSLVVSAGHDRSVRIWRRDRNALRQIAKYDHPARIRVARLSPDGQTLVSASWDGQIAVHDLDADGSIRKAESLLVADAMDAALEPEGRWLAAIDGQGAVTVIDRRAVPHTRLVVAKHSSAGIALAFSRDGRWLASSGLGHDVVLTDMTNPGGPEASRTLKGHDGSVFSLAFREDGRWLATASDDGTARLWAIGTSASSAEIVLVGHTDAVRQIAFLPGPALRVVTASNDRTARLWTADAADPSATKSVVLRGHDDVVTTIAIDTKKPRIVTGGRDGTMRAWDAAERDPGRSIIPAFHRAHKDEVRAFALSHDEKKGVSVDLSGTACGWTFEPVAARCRAAPVPAGDRLGVVPCPDRDAFVVRQRHGKLLVCTIQDTPCEALSAGDANVMAAACGTSRIAAADAKGHVYFWERSGSTATRHELTPHHPGLPLALQLSSDERFLASADQKGSVIVWHLPGTEGEMLTGHTDGVTVLSFAQDSTRLVSAGFDATALEWDLGLPLFAGPLDVTVSQGT